MKKLSRFILRILLYVFLLNGALAPFVFSPTLLAKAQTTPQNGSYACILQDVYFCSAPNEQSALFLLPQTYYVKLVEYQPNYSKIEYLGDEGNAKKLTGYAKTENLTFVDYLPQRPYLYYLFDVHYSLGDEGSSNGSAFLDQITFSCAYYGDFKVGAKTYCYVLRGDTFGYVPKPETLVFEENTEYTDRTATPSEDEPPTPEKKNSAPSIALLVALCLLVPVLASLIVKPPKRPPYEED